MQILGVPVADMLLLIFAAALGFFGHLLLKVAEIRESIDAACTLKTYLQGTPYKTGSKAVAALGGVIALAEPNITPMIFVGAVALGYTADSAGNHLKRLAP